ncbi:MAG: hypothetical protein HYT76_03525 [Deltaproteobacteria bacterium]|nr:hypothetical protein [Deltaproteobacteria bacterium]
MHRTQIFLDPLQYRRLKAMASESNTSLGELIRRLIDRFIGAQKEGSAISSFCGALEDSECRSTNFKKFLYTDGRKNLR